MEVIIRRLEGILEIEIDFLLKLRLKNTIIDKTLTFASENWTLKKER